MTSLVSVSYESLQAMLAALNRFAADQRAETYGSLIEAARGLRASAVANAPADDAEDTDDEVLMAFALGALNDPQALGERAKQRLRARLTRVDPAALHSAPDTVDETTP